MSDKLRKLVPIRIAFGDGEDPSSSKLTALGDQVRNGLTLAEKAIGDIWNQSGDASLIPGGNLTQNALYISNIGRALGSQKYLSPRIPYLSGILKYSDAIAGSATQLNQLRYKPVPAGGSLVSGDFTVSGVAPGGALTTFRATADLVQAAGDWHVTANGLLISFTPITAATLEYKPFPTPDLDQTSTHTVIPDPNTDTAGSTTTFQGIKLAYANDTDNTTGYWLYLPPRKPLLATRKIAQSPTYAGNNVDPTTGKYFFQSTAFGAATGANGVHYRYQFPSEIQTIVNAAVNITLPDNFLYLMDNNTGTIVEGLTFAVDNAAPLWAVKVSGVKLDQIVAELSLTPDIGYVSLKATETGASYKSRFTLVGPGASLAKSISALVANHSNHTHNGIDGTLRINHSDSFNLFAKNSVSWSPSLWTGDDHPQYLHRDGYSAGTRDVYKNGMLGDLLLLSTSSSSNYFNVTADSNKLFFGTNSKALYYKNANSAIVLENSDLDITTASAKVKFENSATAYVDKTRAQAYYDAIHLIKFDAVSAVTQTQTTATFTDVPGVTITVTPPATVPCTVAFTATIQWAHTAVNPRADYRIVFDGNPLLTVSDEGSATAGNSVTTSLSWGTTGAFTGAKICKLQASNNSGAGTLTMNVAALTTQLIPVV